MWSSKGPYLYQREVLLPLRSALQADGRIRCFQDKLWLVQPHKARDGVRIGHRHVDILPLHLWEARLHRSAERRAASLRASSQSPTHLHVLVHRLRKEIERAGFDPWFIEKRRRAIRVWLPEVRVL